MGVQLLVVLGNNRIALPTGKRSRSRRKGHRLKSKGGGIVDVAQGSEQSLGGTGSSTDTADKCVGIFGGIIKNFKELTIINTMSYDSVQVRLWLHLSSPRTSYVL